MTVEFAVALPVVAVVLTTLVAAVLVVDGQGRLTTAAATAARAVGRGDDTGLAAASRIAPGATLAVRRESGLVCVDAARTGAGPFAALTLRATGCAAAGGG